jgi:hypothetical protein
MTSHTGIGVAPAGGKGAPGRGRRGARGLASSVAFGVARSAATAPPAGLAESLKQHLGFSDDDIAEARDGPVTRELEGGSGPTELFVAGMARIDASPDAIAAELRRTGGLVDREGVKQGGRMLVSAVLDNVEERLDAVRNHFAAGR